MSIRADSAVLEPGKKVRLFTLDSTVIDPAAGVLNFHGYKGDGIIVWQGVEYHPWTIHAEGFKKSGEKPATPSLTVANVGGVIGSLCLQYDDLVGAVLTVKTTLAKYLDARNWDGPELVQNGTFDTNLSGWTTSQGSASWTAGQMSLGDDAATSLIHTPVTTEAGVTYTLTFNRADTAFQSRIGSTAGGMQIEANLTATLGMNTRTFVGTGGTVYIGFSRGANVNRALIDNVSVRVIGTNPTADPGEHYPDEVWFLDRKEHEDSTIVKWGLSSALDFNGVVLPRRMIVANQCWWQYRDANCGYAGPPVAKYDDTPTSNPLLDSCSRRPSGCKLRFGENNPLPYGSFPAAGLMR